MSIHTNFILLLAQLEDVEPKCLIFKRFSELCDYINQHNIARQDYKVFLSNLNEISEYEYSLIPDKFINGKCLILPPFQKKKSN